MKITKILGSNIITNNKIQDKAFQIVRLKNTNFYFEIFLTTFKRFRHVIN